MRLLGNKKRREEFSAIAKSLRQRGIQVTGPYRKQDGTLVFSVGNSVVTEAEFLQLRHNGEVKTTRVAGSLGRGERVART